MGKQIVFFATPADLKQLFQIISLKEGIVLDQFGTMIDIESVLNMCIDCFDGKTFSCDLYLTLEGLKISFFSEKKERLINPLESEVIQFRPCMRQPKAIHDTSSVDDQFKIGDYIVIHDTEKYSQLMDEFMEHPRYRENPNYVENGFEHARFWFEPEYFDESGEKVKKSKKLCSLFGALQNRIKTSYKLSNNGFGYIGKNAYASYLLENFVPCSGNTRIAFE